MEQEEKVKTKYPAIILEETKKMRKHKQKLQNYTNSNYINRNIN